MPVKDKEKHNEINRACYHKRKKRQSNLLFESPEMKDAFDALNMPASEVLRACQKHAKSQSYKKFKDSL
jgi:hypothetical protein